MHEMSVVHRVVDMVLEMCEGQDAVRVKSVSLTIGQMHDVVVDLVPGLFNYLARGTVAEGAEVEITQVPAVLKCPACGMTFQADISQHQIACTSCGATTGFTLLCGREFLLDSIEVVHASSEAA